MTTNKPEVFEVYRTRQGTLENVVLLADYEALQAELKKAVAALTDGRFTRCDGPAGWRPPLGNPAGTLIDRIDSLEDECDQLRKDAGRSRAAFCAVIEYMLGEGRWEEPMEFLRCWNEGYFDSLREEWPDAPQAIYYADPLADHDAIDAAMQELKPCSLSS